MRHNTQTYQPPSRAAWREPGEGPDPWSEPDAETEAGPDRDLGMMRCASARGEGRIRMEPAAPRRRGLCDFTDFKSALSREDEAPHYGNRSSCNRLSREIPSRHVPIGFAPYVSPVINPAAYDFYRQAGWRVAIPHETPSHLVKGILSRIFSHGPQSAGYVRLGDTLVPAILGPGDRAALAGVALYDPPALSL